MGEVADRVAEFVTAYSGDLRDESLDGQRLVLGGIVTGMRTVITKARATMAVATLEDLQGSLEVVVFPRLYEQTGATWQEGAILLVAGRVDHRGEEVSLLADLVVDWDAAVARGPEAFAREVASSDRGARRRPGPGVEGNGHGAPPPERGPGVAVGPGRPAVAASPAGTAPVRSAGPLVSPLRPEAWPPDAGPFGVLAERVATVPASTPPTVPAAAPAATASATAPAIATTSSPAIAPAIAPAEPVPAYDEPAGAMAASPDLDDEPPWPDEARARAVDAAEAPTRPTDAGPGGVLHVRFSAAAGLDRAVGAMEALRTLIRARPGSTPVVLHVPVGADEARPMELRSGVAYDAELLAEIRRQMGDGIVELRLD
jgi:DNA polymerase-3 subunit alpha